MWYSLNDFFGLAVCYSNFLFRENDLGKLSRRKINQHQHNGNNTSELGTLFDLSICSPRLYDMPLIYTSSRRAKRFHQEHLTSCHTQDVRSSINAALACALAVWCWHESRKVVAISAFNPPCNAGGGGWGRESSACVRLDLWPVLISSRGAYMREQEFRRPLSQVFCSDDGAALADTNYNRILRTISKTAVNCKESTFNSGQGSWRVYRKPLSN